jgi:hypothetical protein
VFMLLSPKKDQGCRINRRNALQMRIQQGTGRQVPHAGCRPQAKGNDPLPQQRG